jgi:hypothetical protein
MKEKFQNIIDSNGGCIAKDVKIGSNFYCIKPFDDSQESYNIIKSLFSNYIINSFMVRTIERNERGYKRLLHDILELNKKDGLSWYNVFNQDNNFNVGVVGTVRRKEDCSAVGLLYAFKLSNFAKITGQLMIELIFNNFDEIEKIDGNMLSYNKLSQVAFKKLGAIEGGFKKCDNNYIKDSYLAYFYLTRERYNKIKAKNNGVYKTFNISNKTGYKTLHNKARTLKEAIQDFKQSNDVERLNHCEKLFNHLISKYPRVCGDLI